MNAVSIPGSEELEVLSPSCIEIVQAINAWLGQGYFGTSRVTANSGQMKRTIIEPTPPSPNSLATPMRGCLTTTAGQLLGGSSMEPYLETVNLRSCDRGSTTGRACSFSTLNSSNKKKSQYGF
ncbi:hypothetical protein AVEN_128152-1 [Araneus ventricosus]|uniref:Uncharacterized protein n=1 Tax=Araneus ventricosus TaxID=182803 RepID=A0A4Y1ZZQ0_ARAVE|nr:hypothetical protein AVEN_128152-1 [Araneus ventricosus]